MAKEQKHQLTYKIKYNQFGEIKEKVLTGRLLTCVLQEFLEECIKEEDTGIFFELENADVDSLRQSRRFFEFSSNGTKFGIVLLDVEIKSDERNTYLCQLRAKRELLNFTIPEFAKECGLNPGDYKEKEEGHRSMKLSEYASCMKILTLYERQTYV